MHVTSTEMANGSMGQTVERRNYWYDACPLDENQFPPSKQDRFDAIVVGAGFTGIWAAWHLRERDPDATILVLDANQIGFGASSRNAGYLVPHFSSSYTELCRSIEMSQASALAQAGAANLRQVIDLLRSEDIDCDLVDADIVTVSLHPGFDGRIARDIVATEELGVPHKSLSASDLGQLISSPALSTGYSFRGATVHPRKMVIGLAENLKSRNVSFREGIHVDKVVPEGEMMHLETNQGSLRAERVFLAQNAWAQQLPQFRRQVLPVYTYQVVTRVLSRSELDSLGWESRAAFSDRRSILINFRLTPDNRIMFGGRDIVQPFGGRISAQLDYSSRVLSLMRESFEHVFPQLRKVPFEAHWGGAIALTPNHLPSVGVFHDGRVAYAHGCGGHGVAQSFLWAGSGVDMLNGEDTDRVRLPLTAHSGLRYPLEPARFLGGRATRRQLRWYDDVVQAGRKGDKEPPLLTLVNRIFAGESKPR
jgi:glycine/D-amino acid oxidase-like deaminating enzyme